MGENTIQAQKESPLNKVNILKYQELIGDCDRNLLPHKIGLTVDLAAIGNITKL